MRISTYLVPIAIAALALGGCRNKKDANQPVQCPPGQVFDGQYCVMAQATAAPPPGTTTAPPPTTAAPTATTAPAAGPSPVEQLPALIQAHVVSGAQPLGAPVVGAVGGGQQLEVPVQANPGQCYTAVAAGDPGVQDLKVTMEYVSPVPGTSPVLAEDKDQGPTAVMAPQPNCYKWALPMGAPVKVFVRATGAGQAAVQVFVK